MDHTNIRHGSFREKNLLDRLHHFKKKIHFKIQNKNDKKYQLKKK